MTLMDNSNRNTDKARAAISRAEELHARRLSEIVDAICEAHAERNLRTVLVSGPSSSGKTTFAHRLGSVLEQRGLKPVPVSMDDYFVERDKTPLDADGKYDFEAVEAVDLELLNDQLQRLAAGEEVTLPLFDFVTGTRQWQPQPLRLESNSVMILEGLHVLNPRLTTLIPDNSKFRIFISCLTASETPDGQRISTFDVRMLRRIVRDNTQRGRTAVQTIEQWPSVRRGEELYVFPFLGDADTVFDSSLRYELSALRPLAEPLLEAVPEDSAERKTALRLLNILSHIQPITTDGIPADSLLREFVGL